MFFRQDLKDEDCMEG